MRYIFTVTFSCALLLGCESFPARDDRAALSPSEVKRLFVGNTVESFNLNTRLTSFTYYHPDGRAVQERLWARRAGSWSIQDDGKICLAFANAQPKCRHIVLQEGKYYKVLPDESGTTRKIVRYRYFAQGNALEGG